MGKSTVLCRGHKPQSSHLGYNPGGTSDLAQPQSEYWTLLRPQPRQSSGSDPKGYEATEHAHQLLE